jgi:hypothetical protein
MKSIKESQIFYLCVGSILSWMGRMVKCLAALHTHISALEPDHFDSTSSVRYTLWKKSRLISLETSAEFPKTLSVIDDHRSHTKRSLIKDCTYIWWCRTKRLIRCDDREKTLLWGTLYVERNVLHAPVHVFFAWLAKVVLEWVTTVELYIQSAWLADLKET